MTIKNSQQLNNNTQLYYDGILTKKYMSVIKTMHFDAYDRYSSGLATWSNHALHAHIVYIMESRSYRHTSVLI
jgi:hypothetical protein